MDLKECKAIKKQLNNILTKARARQARYYNNHKNDETFMQKRRDSNNKSYAKNKVEIQKRRKQHIMEQATLKILMSPKKNIDKKKIKK